MVALPSYSAYLGSHSSAAVTLMVSFHCMQDLSSAKACWRLYLILQVAEHLTQVFSITPVSVGDEDKNGAEQLQQVAVMSPLKIDQPVREVYYLRGKEVTWGGDLLLVLSVTVFTANTHFSLSFFLLFLFW